MTVQKIAPKWSFSSFSSLSSRAWKCLIFNFNTVNICIDDTTYSELQFMNVSDRLLLLRNDHLVPWFSMKNHDLFLQFSINPYKVKCEYMLTLISLRHFFKWSREEDSSSTWRFSQIKVYVQESFFLFYGFSRFLYWWGSSQAISWSWCAAWKSKMAINNSLWCETNEPESHPIILLFQNFSANWSHYYGFGFHSNRNSRMMMMT